MKLSRALEILGEHGISIELSIREPITKDEKTVFRTVLKQKNGRIYEIAESDSFEVLTNRIKFWAQDKEEGK